MKLTTKFNIVLFSVFTVSVSGAGFFAYEMLQKNARHEVVNHAGMMMEAALAIRGYTVGEIKPLLKLQMTRDFLPQSVPAYAATQTFGKLRDKHPEYNYKEATLNPTNPRNRAVDWESDIIQAFRNYPDRSEIIGTRVTPTGTSLYLARPIRVKKEGCLDCHSTVDAAPTTMLARYGSANGFGWGMNEVVGAQIVTVPMSVPIESARKTFLSFVGTLMGISLLTIIILNIMLRRIVIKPVTKMAEVADMVSMGEEDAPEFDFQGNDEVSTLAKSFNRMRRSLEKAMDLLQENQGNTTYYAPDGTQSGTLSGTRLGDDY